MIPPLCLRAQTAGPPLTESTRWRKCEHCGGYYDILDFASTNDHDGEFAAHPAADSVQ
jgi:hypothetical protein